MKSFVLNILLALALLAVCISWACSGRSASTAAGGGELDPASTYADNASTSGDNASTSGDPASTIADPASKAGDYASIVINAILTRTSVRAYTAQDVTDEQVELILRAAMSAPSAGNKQPWRFVVVRDKSILTQISANLHTMTMAKDAPLAIVVCADTRDTFQGDGFDYWVEDTSAATENLLLAAHALGLGAVWCGIYPQMKRVDYLKQLLKLPEHIIPLNVIPVGWPAGEQRVKDKWKPEHIHQNTWADDAA